MQQEALVRDGLARQNGGRNSARARSIRQLWETNLRGISARQAGAVWPCHLCNLSPS